MAASLVAASVLHFALAAYVVVVGPRRALNWLVAVLLTFTGASALARGVAGTDLGGRLAFDYEWPMSFVVLAIAVVHVVRPRRRLRPWLFAAGAAILATWAFFILQRPLLYPPAGMQRDVVPLAWWALLLDDARYLVTMAAALVLFAWAYVKRPTGSADRTSEYLLIAFALGPLMSAASHTSPPRVTTLFGTLHDTLAFSGTVVLPAIFVVAVFLGARRGHPWMHIAGIGAAFFVLGVVLARSRTGYGDYGELAYLLVRPLIIGYAVLHYQLFDVDVRVKQGFATTLATLASGALFLPVEELVRRALAPSDIALPTAIGAGLAVVLALHSRVQGLSRRASDAVFTGVTDADTAYLAERKRELYRAAVERSLDDRLEPLTDAQTELERLRRTLGIDHAEHAAVLERVRAARLSPGAHAPALPGTALLGRYRVETLLGEGAGGRTYRCRDERLGRVVAVKEIETRGGRDTSRALREARLLAGLRHPRVVTLHDVVALPDRAFLVMEYVPGGSLAERLAKGRLPADDAAGIARDILEGLAALHAAGLVHRDVKPSNILLDADGRALVSDLGIAKREGNVTGVGLGPVGTPAYMAPEQVLDANVDARTDLYAVAALLYEAIKGETYVRSAVRNGRRVEEAIVSDPPPLPIGAPDHVEAFLARGLAKDPALRFADARAALSALQ